MEKITLKLPDGTEHEIKPFNLEEPKITTNVLLLERDIKALYDGYMVRFTDTENSVDVCVRLAK